MAPNTIPAQVAGRHAGHPHKLLIKLTFYLGLRSPITGIALVIP
jgi:hypothetical protein